MKRFRELPSIHQHLIGLAIVLLMAIMLLVLQPAVSYELIVALGVAGVIWLVVSLTALAIHTKRRSDPLYALLQNAYERAKATNDPRLAEFEKRLAEQTEQDKKALSPAEPVAEAPSLEDSASRIESNTRAIAMFMLAKSIQDNNDRWFGR